MLLERNQKIRLCLAMIRFDPLLDFYDPTMTQEAINAHLKEMFEVADKAFQPYLIEIEVPGYSRFSKCFRLDYFDSSYYPSFLEELYSDDFLLINTTDAPFLSDNGEDALYSFLSQLDYKNVRWHFFCFSTPYIEYLYWQTGKYHVFPSYKSRTWGKGHHTLLNIYNYLPKIEPT